jgi:hypothetical protein
MIHDIVFKLKHDIANDSELPLAAMELRSILKHEPQRVTNLADRLFEIDLLRESVSTHAASRIQDILLRMPYPGAIQAYRPVSPAIQVSLDAIGRLTYFRDVFMVFSGQPHEILAQVGLSFKESHIRSNESFSPCGVRLSPIASLHRLDAGKDHYVLRIIAPHCYLECTDHVVRLAQKPADVDRMYDGMLHHLQDNFSRPFAASVQMGYKWIEDFIDDRRPPNAYASHSLFGLRGRFFPRMVRALTNCLMEAAAADTVVDPFAGVGTLGIEASLLGVPSRSYDLNPFFTEVSRAKHQALGLSTRAVAQLDELRNYAQSLRKNLEGHEEQRGLAVEGIPPATISIPRVLNRNVTAAALKTVERLRGRIAHSCSHDAARVANLAIAYYANSMLKKYTPAKTLKCFWSHLSRVLYLDRFLKRLASDGIMNRLAVASYEVGSIKQLSSRERDVRAIITSPPYTTAIDYVGNDVMAYYAMGLQGHEEVEREMIGSTRLGRVDVSHAQAWSAHIPAAVTTAHERIKSINPRKALCLAKYFRDMSIAFHQLAKTLADGGQMAMIVCSEQQFGSNGAKVKYKVADAISEIGLHAGLQLRRRLDIDLTKNGDGGITQEAVLVFQK